MCSYNLSLELVGSGAAGSPRSAFAKQLAGPHLLQALSSVYTDLAPAIQLWISVPTCSPARALVRLPRTNPFTIRTLLTSLA
jgi:hypothetical protein